jgi:hypothetical protein
MGQCMVVKVPLVLYFLSYFYFHFPLTFVITTPAEIIFLLD